MLRSRNQNHCHRLSVWALHVGPFLADPGYLDGNWIGDAHCHRLWLLVLDIGQFLALPYPSVVVRAHTHLFYFDLLLLLTGAVYNWEIILFGDTTHYFYDLLLD